jgi:hypothetical protein
VSDVREFICHPCAQKWRDTYTFWRGYLSACPLCGRQCEAICDTQVFADQKEMKGLFDGPLFEVDGEHPERTEGDLEAERDTIHDEIAEALGAVEADISDIGDSDADADLEGADSGEGF